MEHIHGVDVSWMTHGNPKDRGTKISTRQRSLSNQARDLPSPTPVLSTSAPTNGFHTAPSPSPPPATGSPTLSSPVPSPNAGTQRPGLLRGASEKKDATPLGSSPQRRGSWFSNMTSKFSGSNANSSAATQSPTQANSAAPSSEPPVPKANPVKNAVLQHATKPEGEGPYIPAPPRTSSQTGIMQVFRRLSSSTSSGNGAPTSGTKGGHQHGLVERRILNVDRHRERCTLPELKQAKLRRVAFCVDVEIAPMPKYVDPESCGTKKPAEKEEKTTKRKTVEKGEGEALKNPAALESQKEEISPKEVKKECEEKKKEEGKVDAQESSTPPVPSSEKPSDAKKKEKKKKSEEERKARKEKKRKQAEANGSIPMEIHLDSDSSGDSTTNIDEGPKTQAQPTTNPVRIYRRCCQLRETPILKKITEQLTNPVNSSTKTGMVDKLDLTGYWLQLPDLVTLGDYLAVVPVREVILENCGLTDEGLRVILAGLLAAKKPEARRKKHFVDHGLTHQGGAVERLVLKNNKIGPEGWRYICLFIYLCRTLQSLDLSSISFPQPHPPAKSPPTNHHGPQANAGKATLDICGLLAKCLGERLGGSTLGLLSLGDTGLSTAQLGIVIDGVIKCGIRRLGLARNGIDAKGMEHVARFLQCDACEGLDLGGNDLRDQLGVIAETLFEEHPLSALSLAECNLVPSSLCKLFPKLVRLESFRFIDLSHNPELFRSNPSAVSVLRRYLPKLLHLKRMHLADCALTSEQVIALAEVLPEISELAHINLLENPKLVELCDAKTEEKQEEAIALFASLLAAARVSHSLVAVEIEVPSDQSNELIKAMAKHVVAYCLRNMERLPVNELAASTIAKTEASSRLDPEYPDVLQHLVGHDAMKPETDSDVEGAPDEDYVIGGTGVVKALACCLDNHDESRRQSGEFIRDMENGVSRPQSRSRSKVPPGKAKETSKHLLSSARKIRHRLQPAIVKARAAAGEDAYAYHRLIFLDNTLKGIIKRFEDEFPDTRETADSAIAGMTPDSNSEARLGTSVSSGEIELYQPAISDGEDEMDLSIRSPSLSRSNSVLSHTSKVLANEEGKVFRAGHKFRTGILKPEHYHILSAGLDDIAETPAQVRMLSDMLDELGDEDLKAEAARVGVVTLYRERREDIMRRLRALDPEHWDRFVESQYMARANTDTSLPAAAPTRSSPERSPEEAVVEE